MSARSESVTEKTVPHSGRFWPTYGILTGTSLLAAGVLAGIGFIPTARWCGDEAGIIILAGCGTSWIAGAVAAVPVALAFGAREGSTAEAVLLATGLRFLVTLGVTAACVFTLDVDRTALVAWVAVSYFVLLVVETLLTVRLVRRADPKVNP